MEQCNWYRWVKLMQPDASSLWSKSEQATAQTSQHAYLVSHRSIVGVCLIVMLLNLMLAGLISLGQLLAGCSSIM